MKKVLIKTNKLCKTFSNGGVMQHVLKNLDIEIYEGDFTVIMGASGAGKSTLMYALSGMDTPTLGEIYYEDEKISDYSVEGLANFRRKNCGFVFQQIYLLDGMSVMDNIFSVGLLENRNKKELKDKALGLLKSVGFDETITKKRKSQLSGGEAQRVGLVRALINDPKIVFADEPTGALNSQTGTAVLDALTKINENGQSIIMVTHDLKSARRANRILYLKDGVIIGECDLGKYKPNDENRHIKLRAFLTEMGW